jgi:hypothetical protein
MGGTLPAGETAPTCTVFAAKDADGANLDRIQIIKGWVDANGEPQDEVIDIVWSGNRKPGPDGRLPPVGSTVDLKTATYTNDIGSAQLMGSWAAARGCGRRDSGARVDLADLVYAVAGRPPGNH